MAQIAFKARCLPAAHGHLFADEVSRFRFQSGNGRDAPCAPHKGILAFEPLKQRCVLRKERMTGLADHPDMDDRNSVAAGRVRKGNGIGDHILFARMLRRPGSLERTAVDHDVVL